MTKDEFVRTLVVALINNGSFNMTGKEFLELAKLATDEVDKLRPFAELAKCALHEDGWCENHNKQCEPE